MAAVAGKRGISGAETINRENAPYAASPNGVQAVRAVLNANLPANIAYFPRFVRQPVDKRLQQALRALYLLQCLRQAMCGAVKFRRFCERPFIIEVAIIAAASIRLSSLKIIRNSVKPFRRW